MTKVIQLNPSLEDVIDTKTKQIRSNRLADYAIGIILLSALYMAVKNA